MTKKLSLEDFFKVEHEAGQTQDNKNYKRLFYFLGKQMELALNPESIFEIGCGPGGLMEYFVRATNVDYTGVDLNPHSREYFLSRNPGYEDKYILKDILEFPITSFGDLAVSIETFEHIEDEILDIIIPKLAKHYKYFWFSSTPKLTNPEQDAEWGHINVKYDHEWVNKFELHGWQFKEWARTPTEWSMLFESVHKKSQLK